MVFQNSFLTLLFLLSPVAEGSPSPGSRGGGSRGGGGGGGRGGGRGGGGGAKVGGGGAVGVALLTADGAEGGGGQVPSWNSPMSPKCATLSITCIAAAGRTPRGAGGGACDSGGASSQQGRFRKGGG